MFTHFPKIISVQTAHKNKIIDKTEKKDRKLINQIDKNTIRLSEEKLKKNNI